MAGPRRPLTDFPVQPNGFISVDLISNDFNEAAFNPRKSGNSSFVLSQVNLPRVTVAQPACVPASWKRIPQQILAAHIEKVIHSKAQTEPALEEIDADAGG